MEGKRVAIIGGTGYIGTCITVEAAKHYPVTLISRRPYKHMARKAITHMRGSVLDRKFLTGALNGCNMIVYLAAVVRSFNKTAYRENAQGLCNTIAAMQENGIKRILYFSTQNVHSRETGHYGNSKRHCEKILTDSRLDYVILRPNYVYGIDKKNDFYRLLKIMKKTGICPIIGDGKTMIQPINKADVAEITIRLMQAWPHRRTINLSGKRTITLNEAARIIAEKANIRLRLLHIPLSVLKALWFAIPFDIRGYTEHRLSPKGEYTLYGRRDFIKDMENIARLASGGIRDG